MSNTQELCRFDRSGVLNGGPKGRQNTKTRNFLRKKLQKLEFRHGGQTAPSEPAPRVGGTGDVLAGLLPSHSNFICILVVFYVYFICILFVFCLYFIFISIFIFIFIFNFYFLFSLF